MQQQTALKYTSANCSQ